MEKELMNLLALSFYVLFMGFCFCDGFRLHILRKLIWFSTFVFMAVYSMRVRGEFDLSFILPVTSGVALLVCAYDKHKSMRSK